MPYGLDDKTVESILNTFNGFPQIDKVILYGSRAKGNYRPGSDIDFVVKGRFVTSEILYKIMDQLDDLYLPYKIDISIFDHIDNENLIEHINRVGVDFYNSPREDHGE